MQRREFYETYLKSGDGGSKRWIYIRSDRSIKIDTGCVAVGGVFRDHNGEWILGFNRTLVQARQQDRVMMQTDTFEVIGAIKESLSNGSNSTLIRRILQILQNEEIGQLNMFLEKKTWKLIVSLNRPLVGRRAYSYMKFLLFFLVFCDVLLYFHPKKI